MSTKSSTSMRIIEKLKRRRSSLLCKAESTESKYEDNVETLPLMVGYLTEDMIEHARNFLNETDEVRTNCLNEMKNLIQGEENLLCRTDDIFLLQFLRARKFDVKKAFKLLQNYFEFRKEYSHIYDSSFEIPKVKQVYMNNFVGYLVKRDRAGCVVLIGKLGKWRPEIDSFEDLFRAVSAMLVFAAEDPATQVYGFRIVLDFRSLSWKQMKYFTLQNMLMLVRSTQFCFPARYKAIHLFSENKLFSMIMSMIQPFLTSKIRSRLMHHGKDISALQEFIPASVLPTEYGGTYGPFDNSSLEEVMDSKKNQSLMLDMLKYGYK